MSELIISYLMELCVLIEESEQFWKILSIDLSNNNKALEIDLRKYIFCV